LPRRSPRRALTRGRCVLFMCCSSRWKRRTWRLRLPAVRVARVRTGRDAQWYAACGRSGGLRYRRWASSKRRSTFSAPYQKVHAAHPGGELPRARVGLRLESNLPGAVETAWRAVTSSH